MKKHIFISLLIILGLLGCKNAPTFSPDNELDPGSENYNPLSPLDINISINKDKNLVLDWSQLNSNIKYLSGYKIYKSVTDTINFSEIGNISINSHYSRNNDMTKYQFTDPEIYNGVYSAYKIEGYYIQNNDTVFSDPVISTYIDNDFQISSVLMPFKIQPSIELFWTTGSISPDAIIDFFSRQPKSEDFTTLGSVSIQNESAGIEIDIYQPEETEYYYRITLDSISSKTEKLEYELPIPVLELGMGTEQNDETSAELELRFSSEYTDYEATLDQFTLRLFESENPIEITALGEADTTLAYKTTLQFDPPSTPLLLNDLNPSKYYMVTVSGLRGSFNTYEEYKYLTFNFVNTLSTTFSNNLYEDDGFQGSFDSNSQRVLYSFDRSTLGVINTNNGQIEHSFNLNQRNNELSFFSTTFAEFDGVQDAIITSTSSDKVQIWDPNTYKLITDIPNYSENSVKTSPWDFTVISTYKLLIAYLPENYESKRAIFITIWDQSKQEHELVYKINQDIIYPEQTKLLYNQDYDLFHILQRAINQEDYNRGEYPKLKLLSIDSNNYKLISNVEIMNLGQGSVENMTLNDNGDYLYIFNVGGYTPFDVQNSEQNYTGYFRYLKSLVSAKDSNFKCLGGNSSDEADIQCFWKGFDSSPLLFEHDSDNYILGLTVNDTGTRLAALYQNAFQVFDFTKSWRLDR